MKEKKYNAHKTSTIFVVNQNRMLWNMTPETKQKKNKGQNNGH